jgi:tripartite-type tricarboxylate transporter receptor subunit TctC
VIPFGKNANVLVVLPSKGWKTVQDLVAAAKRSPGSFNYGSAGVGTATHISAERFRLSAGFEATHIPYKGGPEALTDVLGGRIEFYYCPLSTAIPLVRDGRLLALAVSTPTRASALPDVPTSIEAGYPDSDYTIWYGVFMPAKTPPEVVARFHAAAARVLQAPKMQEKLAQLAVDPMPMTSAEFNKQVVDEIAANAQLVKAAGIK